MKTIERLGLIRVSLPIEAARVAQEQVKPLVEYYADRFSAWENTRELLKGMALDAYTQGLIHGNQIQKVKQP